MSEQNIGIVQQAYAAFGRGDIDGILATLSDDISWEPVIGAGAHVPQAGKRQGKAAVREFFEVLRDILTFEAFEPREFIAQGDRVAVVGYYAARPKSTGRVHRGEWVMLFTVRDGRITAFREFTDSAGLNAAWEPRAVSAQ